MTGSGMYVGHDPGVSNAVSWIADRTRCDVLDRLMLAKAIHDDRVREIEQRVRNRRLLQPSEDEASLPTRSAIAAPQVRTAGGSARSGSACEPA